jgi:hypothetical protein
VTRTSLATAASLRSAHGQASCRMHPCGAVGSAAQAPGATLAGMAGPVYVKLNAGARTCRASPYAGGDRGVLVQLGGCQLGHFPLGLIDEAMSAPAPGML